MGKHSRNKGKRWEVAVVNLLKQHGLPAQRTAALQAHPDDTDPDVTIKGQAIHIEAKHHKKDPSKEAFEQANRQRAPGWFPVAITKADHVEPVVTMSLRDISEWMEQGGFVLPNAEVRMSLPAWLDLVKEYVRTQ